MKKYFIIYLFLFFYISCDIDWNNTNWVSKDVTEAKEKKVFLAEYKVDTFLMYDSKYKFPIDKIWIEKDWELLSVNGKFTYRINDSADNSLVLQTFKNSPLNADNFCNKWIIKEDSSMNCGVLGDSNDLRMFLIRKNKSVPKQMFFKIYLLNKEHNINSDLRCIGIFTARKFGNGTN